VCLHRDLADAELGADLFVHEARDNQGKYLALACAERGVSVLERPHLCLASEREVAPVESGSNRGEQHVVSERFRQKLDRPGLHGLDRHRHVTAAGDENDGHVGPVDRDALIGELRRLTANTGTRRVLLVDDNEVSRYILRDLLDQPWLDIREAASGTEALSALNEQLPDAVILDLLMPDISGFEILRQLRSQVTTKSLPVLIYTSKVLSETEKAQLESWRAGIIRKEDITTRLSAQPFLDWIRSVGLAPDDAVGKHHA